MGGGLIARHVSPTVMPKRLHRTEGFASPSTAKIFLQDVSRLIPMRALEFLYDNFPSASLNSMRANREITHRFAKELLDHKSDSIARGKGSRDVMSILGMYSTVTFSLFVSLFLSVGRFIISIIMPAPLYRLLHASIHSIHYDNLSRPTSLPLSLPLPSPVFLTY